MYRYVLGYKGELHKFSDADKDRLLNTVVTFLQKNNISYSAESVSKSIDRQSKIATAKKKVSFADAVNGAKALLRYSTGHSVSNAEIARRSRICLNCPLRDTVSYCGSCGGAGKIARFVGNLRKLMRIGTDLDSDIKVSYCGVCQCSLALMVPSQLQSFKPDSGRPDDCWLNPKSTNYTHE